ncbi:MAG: undecaprenyldiphospho-muramoylpentapeptide beta-N-acetylglucosaminyltransferase [Desulfitobacterium sp.]|nr:undecaprenyldiphospho-muramoylpentapeptide beta-N-acetylglucosaminyltransferase [Desulfitobacterium sp.]
MRVIVTGGGTGGHIYPALAIAKGILARKPDCEILYVGIRDGMEARLVPESGLEFEGISGQGLPRSLSLETIKVAGKSLKALWETKQILKRFKPDLVVGTGGYVSGPVVLTAALFGIPTLLHEQNALPGITNKILSSFVRKVLVTFPESMDRFRNKGKVILTGLPVRPEVGKIVREEGAKEFGLDPKKLTILVAGGSRGALSINKSMATVLKYLEKNPQIQLLWATGSATHKETITALENQGIKWERENWKIKEYIKDMPKAYACSDLFVGRAGATTLAEIMVAGKPGILIPYPYAAENHQEYNARALEKGGAAKVVLDGELDGDKLWALIEETSNPQQLNKMARKAKELGQPDALEKIIQTCFEIAWN